MEVYREGLSSKWVALSFALTARYIVHLALQSGIVPSSPISSQARLKAHTWLQKKHLSEEVLNCFCVMLLSVR